MENKKIIEFGIENKKVTSIESFDDLLVITFNNNPEDTLTLESYHDQDCCENVYADWSIIKSCKKQIMDKEIKSFAVKGVPEIGLLLCFGEDILNRILVPCYNEQNGYYSSNLELILRYEGFNCEINVSDFVEDKIY